MIKIKINNLNGFQSKYGPSLIFITFLKYVDFGLSRANAYIDVCKAII